MNNIKIGLAQINPTIGNIKKNTQLIIDKLIEGKSKNIDLIAFPEMTIIGYPAKDLLFQKNIIKDNLNALDKIKIHTKYYKIVIVGCCIPIKNVSYNKNKQNLYNAYALFRKGNLIKYGFKICLPNYSVFNEYRYFIPGKDVQIYKFDKIKLGIIICEDLWYKELNHPIYLFNPIKKLKEQGVNLLLSINASPYYLDKHKERLNLVCYQAKKYKIPIGYVNTWGANDELIFDGGSFFVDHKGQLIKQGKFFNSDLLITDFEIKNNKVITKKYSTNKNKDSTQTKIYKALSLGKRDYHKKCEISKSVIGISGGIDSAVSLAIDINAIGSENVLGIISPSRFSSKEGFKNALTLCKNFNIKYKIIPIEEKNKKNKWIGVITSKYKRFINYIGKPKNKIVFENQQAIDRMSILRAIANEDGRLISGTSNKSELAMGYATICGDLQADILIIGDLYKTEVYSLAKYINKLYKKEMIPQNIIKQIPSAELCNNQKDPFDYKRLDHFLQLRLEKYLEDNKILKYKLKNGTNLNKNEIKKWNHLLNISEHKRFKSACILKINSVSFGEDWQFPIVKKINLYNN